MSHLPTQSSSQPSSSKSFAAKDWLILGLIAALLFCGYQILEMRRENAAAMASIASLNEQLKAAKPAMTATADTVEHAAKTSKRVLGIFDQVLDQVEGKSK